MTGANTSATNPNGQGRFSRGAVHVLTVAAARGAGLGISLLVSVLMANRFGASAQADAFFIARNLVLDGIEAVRRVVLVQVVPLFIAAERQGTTPRVIGRTAAGLFGAGCLAAAAIAISAEFLVGALEIRSDRASLVAELLPVFGLLIPLVLMVAALGGVFIARRRFGRAELAMIAPRLAVAATLLLLVPPLGVTALALAMVAGAVAALVFVGVAALRALRADAGDAGSGAAPPGMGRGRTLAVNGLVQGYGQLCLWIDYAFIAQLPIGAFAVIDYSQRLMQLLPGVVSTSIATVLLTDMARRSAEAGALPALVARRAASGLAAVTPLAVILVVLSHEIVQLLLGHGQFSPEAVDTTATLMLAFAPMVPIGLLMNILFVALIADTQSFRFGAVTMVYAVALATRLVLLTELPELFGVIGVPMAGATASLVLILGLCLRFRNYGRAFLTGDFALALMRILLACGIMAVGLVALILFVPDIEAGRLLDFCLLAATAGFGAAVYILAGWLLGIPEVRAAIGWFRARAALVLAGR